MRVWSCALLSEIVENRISVVTSSTVVFKRLDFIEYRILIFTTSY